MMVITAAVIMTTEVEVLIGAPTNVAFIQTSPMKKGDQSVPPAHGSYNERKIIRIKLHTV